jgi:peroxiredoxin Q/BCP
MTKAIIGKPAPDFNLPTMDNEQLKSSDLIGKNVVLYFYPKDDTPGCTLEAQDFRDNIAKFKKLNTVILGVSRDSIKSHEKFRDKYCLPFDLISDENETLCQAYDVMKMKNMYGKQVRGIERSTFLIDSEGLLRKEWRKVKVEGHVTEILAALNT